MTQREAVRELQLHSRGGGSSVTPADLKAAYRKRSLETHPDKPGGSAEAFVRVHQAYECLSQTKTSKEQQHEQNAAPPFSTEEQMQYASEFFFREFADFLDNSDTAVDSFIDSLFHDGTTEPTFASRQGKRLAKWLARSAVGLFKKVLEMDNLEITINGQRMSAAELKTIREILKKQQRSREKISSKNKRGPKDDL